MKKKITDSITFKSLAGIAIILVLFAVMIGMIGYVVFSDAITDQYEEGAFGTADTASIVVDGEKVDELVESNGETDEYDGILNQLDTLCNVQDATFIYVIQPDTTDYGHITFILDALNENCGFDRFDYGYVRETTNDDYREKYQRLYDGESDRELVIRNTGYIQTDPHITAMIPLRSDSGETMAILCVQRQMDKLTEIRRVFLRRVLIVLAVILVIAIVGMWMFQRKLIIDPLEKITEEASRFANENVSTGNRLTDTIKSHDEIGVLAGSIDDMETQIHDYVENLTEVTKENERIGTELGLATRIQKEMLTSTFPVFPERSEFTIYASMDPAREVGGDFYDFFLVDDDHLCLVIADVSGKGVPAALFMMAAKIMISDIAAILRSPAKILEAMNNTICEKNNEKMFITVWIGMLEISSGRMICANAGHEYPVLRAPDGKYELIKDKHNFVIGGIKGIKYKEYELMLEEGAQLFLYTDGLTEAQNKDKDMFGIDRVLMTLNSDIEASPEETIEHMRSDTAKFADGAERFDDMTMLCMKYNGTGDQE